jgi:HrpA-like RNA helicase
MFGNKVKHGIFEVKVNSFPVNVHAIGEGKPILTLVNELSGTLTKDTQMLVFFPSVSEVQQATKMFNQSYKKRAFSLFGNQSNEVQENAIRDGQIFFSTSIAETSLTFPRLKYVVDSRLSRIMCYDTRLEIMISE